ncbi:MAG: ATP synthase F1 subunit delta [Deltaproteobacteria bacterium]|nr:ATP synthase F1 subunit delta [Deltaproteobacteria bacterium]
MSKTSPVARRYAHALVETTAKADPRYVDKIADELDGFSAAIGESKDLKNVLMNPAFSLRDKQRALVVVAKALGLSRIATRFVGILVENDRVNDLGPIAVVVRELADARSGRVRVEVESAAPLTPSGEAALRSALEARTKKQIDMTVKVDPSLLGGLRARIGSTVLDGTVRTQIDRLRESLLQP